LIKLFISVAFSIFADYCPKDGGGSSRVIFQTSISNHISGHEVVTTSVTTRLKCFIVLVANRSPDKEKYPCHGLPLTSMRFLLPPPPPPRKALIKLVIPRTAIIAARPAAAPLAIEAVMPPIFTI
jgi:hypothetical protein